MFPSLVLVVVLPVDEVRLAAAAASEVVLPVVVEVPEEVVPVVVVASRGEVVASEAAAPLVVVSRQSLSCLLPSYFGVWGNRVLLQEPLCLYTLVHTTKEKCCLSFRKSCSLTLSLVSQCFTISSIFSALSLLFIPNAPGQFFFSDGATTMFRLWLLLVAEEATFCGNDVNYNRRVRAF